MQFLVKLVFQVEPMRDGRAEFDEQFRIIHADDERTAFSRATILGEQEQGAFSGPRETTIRWRFIGVSDIHALESLADGMQLFSSTVHEDPQTYIPYLRLRAGALAQSAPVVL